MKDSVDYGDLDTTLDVIAAWLIAVYGPRLVALGGLAMLRRKRVRPSARHLPGAAIEARQ